MTPIGGGTGAPLLIPLLPHLLLLPLISTVGSVENRTRYCDVFIGKYMEQGYFKRRPSLFH
jgi:hypothetical protein